MPQQKSPNSTPLTIEFGAAIRRRRREVGLTQEELALTVGTDRRVIGRLERGVANVRLTIALNAARALGLATTPTVPGR